MADVIMNNLWRESGYLMLNIFELFPLVMMRVRGRCVGWLRGLNFKKVGKFVKIRGARNIFIGKGVSVGDFCWVEAVIQYAGEKYASRLELGSGVSISDLTHISCVSYISIGDNCLIGSKVYIGDHSHGSLLVGNQMFNVPPARRPLGDVAPIYIGENSWICDGAVILAGTRLADNSIVGANSVVRLQTDRAALIAGVPAKVIRYLD